MTQDDAFLQAILEAPDDDAPRLIYADWLDEHGDPRGAFIRIQCQLARMPEDDPRRAALEVEEAPLLSKMRQELVAGKPPAWACKIPAWARKACWGAESAEGPCEFERGFVARIHTSAGPFLKGIETLLRKTPLQHVRLWTARRLIGAVADCPHLAHLRSLELPWQKLGNEGMGVLLASPHLGGLRTLDVSRTNLQVAGVKALAQAVGLTELRHLKLQSNRVYDAGVEAIASSESLSRLESLSLPDCQVGVRGTRALAGSRTLQELRDLDLSRNRIGDAGAEALASAADLPALTTLRLCWARITSPGASALLSSTRLPRLSRIELADNPMDADIWRVVPASHVHGRFHLTLTNLERTPPLAGSPLLAACTGLELRGSGLSDEGAAVLAGAAEAAGLRDLSLFVMAGPGQGGMGQAGMRALAHSPHLAQVHRLCLIGRAWRDQAALLALLAALLDGPMAIRLTHLELRSFPLNDNLLTLLAGSDALDGLQQLRLRDMDGGFTSRAAEERFGPRLFF